MNTKEKANIVIDRMTAGELLESIRLDFGSNDQEWSRICLVTYATWLQRAKKERHELLKKHNTSGTSDQEIEHLLDLNERLCRFALCVPTIARQIDVEAAENFVNSMPESEKMLLSLIESMTMDPRIRALQNAGRISHFAPFKRFHHLVEAATLCYYRGNYASSYLSLVPVIEGVILRWSGYPGSGNKPEFADIRKFFRNSHLRQPCPGNPLFHLVFTKACSGILNDHLYKPTPSGPAFSNFNRHLAAHLLSDNQFATRDNCIRLFLLLDLMTEIYYYETRCQDPRWTMKNQDYSTEHSLYASLRLERSSRITPEFILLGGLIGTGPTQPE